MSYKSVFPDSVKTSYNPNENISFSMEFSNESLVGGSVRLYGQVNFKVGGVDTLGTDTIDTLTGVHSAISSISVSTANQGVIQQLLQPARFRKMRQQASQDVGDLVSRSDNVTALCTARTNQMNSLLKGKAGSENIQPFCIPLDVCLNQTNGNVPFSKTGKITIDLRTASAFQFMNGTNATAKYELNDLELHYQTAPENPKEQVEMLTSYSMKYIADSSRTSIRTRVPAEAISCSISMMPTDEENAHEHNALKCAVPPGLQSVQYNLNDGLNLVRYEMKTREQQLLNYFESLGENDKNQISISEMDLSNNEFGLGLAFGGPVDLSQKPFGFDMVSSIDNTTKHSVYLFFQGLIRL